MHDTNLDYVTLIQFKDIILIPIKGNIEKLFDSKEIKFQLTIKDEKIVLIGPKIKQSPTKKPTLPQEVSVIV